MNSRKRVPFGLLALVVVLLGGVWTGSPEAPEPAAIAWYSDLAQARADAERLQRPLFLMAATPQCRGIAGMW